MMRIVMNFCTRCTAQQYCQRLSVPLFTDAELSARYFQTDFKAFLVAYTFRHHIRFSQWPDHLIGLYRDYRGWIRGADGDEHFLDLGVFEDEHIREWFRDYIQPVPEGVTPRLRGETKERVRALATIMRAHFPVEALMWGLRPDNDQ
jgi:hypothetical protein